MVQHIALLRNRPLPRSIKSARILLWPLMNVLLTRRIKNTQWKPWSARIVGLRARWKHTKNLNQLIINVFYLALFKARIINIYARLPPNLLPRKILMGLRLVANQLAIIWPQLRICLIAWHPHALRAMGRYMFTKKSIQI